MYTFPRSKDPDEVLDYQTDWSARLEAGETIASSTWIVAQGAVTLQAFTPAIAGGLTTTWVSGGAAGETCVLTNRIVTSQGRTYDKSGRLRVRQH